MTDEVYNPLDKLHLAESIARRLLDRPAEPLGAVTQAPPFKGAGVYVIYYAGRFPAYASVAGTDTPIYVGKAVPSGARKGKKGSLEAAPEFDLHKRLREHAESIQQAAHLELSEFTCRYLVVDDIFIPLAESLLINNHEPLWNIRLSGFGIHDPGGGRYSQQRSQWDTVHPGRPWAMKCAVNKKANQIIADFGGGNYVPADEPQAAVAEPDAPEQCPKFDPPVS